MAGERGGGSLWTCPASRRSRVVVQLHVVPLSSRCHSDRCIAVINTLSDFLSLTRFLILSFLPSVFLLVPHWLLSPWLHWGLCCYCDSFAQLITVCLAFTIKIKACSKCEYLLPACFIAHVFFSPLFSFSWQYAENMGGVWVLSWLSHAAARPSQSPAESYFTIYLHVIMAMRCRY